VTVVEDDATAAAVASEPVCAAVVPVEAVLVGLGDGWVAEAGPGAVGGWRQAGWAPAVVVDPVGDRVLGDFGLVIGLAEAAADFGGEAALPVGVAGGESAPIIRSRLITAS
jgi:hypothetical protein